MSAKDRISLLVSDIDGTLVTSDKRLTEAAIAAALRLQEAGVRLSLVSSRPPAGFAMLTEPLQMKAPIGAFNGGAILNPDLTIIEETLVDPAAARIALAAFAEFGIDAWLFTRDTWYVTDADGAYVPKERRTCRIEPQVAETFEPLPRPHRQTRRLDEGLCRPRRLRGRSAGAARRRGDGQTFAALLSRCDAARLRQGRGDATYRTRDERAVLSEVAVIGDQANDLPMFEVAAYRIAMGNGIDAVKQMADFVSDDNEHDGWAAAIDRFVLPRAALAHPA